MSLQLGVLRDTRQAQPRSLPCQPSGTELGQRHGQWHRVGGCQGAGGCTHLERAQSSILQHPLPVKLQTSLAGKGPLRDPRIEGEPPCTHRLSHQSSAPAEGLSPKLAAAGSTQEGPSSGSGSAPAALHPPGGAELCWAPWGRAQPDPGRCVRKLPYVSLKGAKCSVSQCLERGIRPPVLPSTPHGLPCRSTGGPLGTTSPEGGQKGPWGAARVGAERLAPGVLACQPGHHGDPPRTPRVPRVPQGQ